jgi:hypothetical protein
MTAIVVRMRTMITTEDAAVPARAVTYDLIPQVAHCGASAWIAHSKLSNTWLLPAIRTSKVRS